MVVARNGAIELTAAAQLTWPSGNLDRLTSVGHKFAEALRSDIGFAAVKKSFVGTSLSVMRDIAVAPFKREPATHGFIPPG
jgi:hypothetical protein